MFTLQSVLSEALVPSNALLDIHDVIVHAS